MGAMDQIIRLLRPVVSPVVREGLRTSRTSVGLGQAPRPHGGNTPLTPASAADYPGDYRGCPTMVYSPREDRQCQPGEIAWTWVPFEEDHSRGKDRPVLVISSDGDWLLAVPATSQDHDQDAAQERREGRYWMDIGSGSWDAQRRATEVRLDRIIRVHPDAVRRIAGRVDETTFNAVAQGVRKHWSD